MKRKFCRLGSLARFQSLDYLGCLERFKRLNRLGWLRCYESSRCQSLSQLSWLSRRQDYQHVRNDRRFSRISKLKTTRDTAFIETFKLFKFRNDSKWSVCFPAVNLPSKSCNFEIGIDRIDWSSLQTTGHQLRTGEDGMKMLSPVLFTLLTIVLFFFPPKDNSTYRVQDYSV